MDSTTVSSKGQVIIPKAVRDSQQWPAGTVLRVVARDGGVLLTREPLFEPTLPAQAAGCLKPALVLAQQQARERGARPKRAADLDKALRARALAEDRATRS